MPKMIKFFVRIASVLVLVGVLLALFWPGGVPSVDSSTSRPGVGRGGTTLRVKVTEPIRGISAIRVEAVQAGRSFLLAEQELPPPPPWALWRKGEIEKDLEVELSDETVPGLTEGTLTVNVSALGAGAVLISPRETIDVVTLPVRFVPPAVGVTSIQNYAAQGGSGIVVYRVSGSAVEEGGRDGVEAGGVFFPGKPHPNGNPEARFALYGVPYELEDPARILLLAEDALGNRATVRFLDRFFPRPLRRDTIQLSVDFMQKVVPEILAQTPELTRQDDLLANYLEVNGGLREQNAQALRDLARSSRPAFLWSGPFEQLPNSQVTSAFADRRTYVFDGKIVDHQDHLGFDLASVRGAPVPAANGGIVVLARYFGIYGNTVVLDHGFGLMSLQSHLSAIEVSEGDEVAKGQALGRTGQTGLAGGDHLHFTLLIEGLPVNPIEWWDPKWVEDRVLSKLRVEQSSR